MQRGLFYGEDFPLTAFVAAQQQGHFTRFLVHLRHQPQVIRPAFDAVHVKLAERAIARRLAGLVIFSAHEISRGIHAAKLSHALDNACPTENFSCGFSYCPGSRVAQATRRKHCLSGPRLREESGGVR